MATDPNAIAPIDAVAPVSNTPYPATLTPTQATSLVNQYGIDPTQVLSNQNITQTTTNPAPAPDDLLGIRADLYNTQGVNAAQTAYQQAMQAASSATLGLNERLTGLRGRAVSLSKITGTQAQERAVSQGEIDALNESARLAQADYAAKKGNADEMFQIRNQEISEKKAVMLQYPGAKITYGDSMEQVTAKLTSYQKQQEKDEWKKTLKQMALSLGVKTSGSRKELEKRISKANKSALNDAKEEHELKMEGMRMDIENTKSTIANRGGGGSESAGTWTKMNEGIDPSGSDTTYYNSKTGEFKNGAELYGAGQNEVSATEQWNQQESAGSSNNNVVWWNPSTWF